MTAQNKSPLLPCPFCEGPVEILREDGFTFVSCLKCGAEGSKAGKAWTDSKGQAIKRWNTRVNSNAGLIDALKRAFDYIEWEAASGGISDEGNKAMEILRKALRDAGVEG